MKDAESFGIATIHQELNLVPSMSVEARVLILDEPTAALSGTEVSQLFNVMDQLRRRGVGMIFISHHLDEIARIADSVSVLRDGQCVAELPQPPPRVIFVRHMTALCIFMVLNSIRE